MCRTLLTPPHDHEGHTHGAMVFGDAVCVACGLLIFWLNRHRDRHIASLVIVSTLSVCVCCISIMLAKTTDVWVTASFFLSEIICSLCLLHFLLAAGGAYLSSGYRRLALVGAVFITIVSLKDFHNLKGWQLTIAGTLAGVGVQTLTIKMWSHSVAKEAKVEAQARKSNESIKAAIRVLFSALPKSTRCYVTSPSSTTLPHLPVCKREGKDPVAPTVSALSSIGEGQGRDSSLPGTVKNITKEDAIIAFVSVSSRDNVAEAGFIRDLSILMGLFDVLVLDASRVLEGVSSLEKIKGTQESLILRIRYIETDAEDAVPVGQLCPKKGFDARCIFHLCLYAQMSVSILRRAGVALDTIAGVRAGVCSGSVTGGVLGSQELMYDIFGDTVNTAARLMQNAGLWDVLVTELTAQSVMRVYPDNAGGLFDVPFAPKGFSLAFSPSQSLTLKGKGQVSVRSVCFSQDTLASAESLMMQSMSRVVASNGNTLSEVGKPDDWVSK
ncbi:hypothetical protein KIPB_004024, partial [Kipferlia bialata]|eukprot:g4024.t1